MKLTERKLRKLIRQSIIQEINDGEAILNDLIAAVKIHPLAGALLDGGELVRDISEIIAANPYLVKPQGMSDAEYKQIRKNSYDLMTEKIESKIIDFVVDQVVTKRKDEIDFILEVTFDTDTSEILTVSLELGLIGLIEKIFNFLGASSDYINEIINKLENDLKDSFNRASEEFKELLAGEVEFHYSAYDAIIANKEKEKMKSGEKEVPVYVYNQYEKETELDKMIQARLKQMKKDE